MGEPIRCPRCGGTNISGLMSAFWVSLLPDGSPDGDWSDWDSCTELSDRRMCRDCEFEFESD